MDRGLSDDGSIGDLPWTAVFDPVANARALSAIQAEGFRAATRLVDRFVTIAETAGNGGRVMFFFSSLANSRRAMGWIGIPHKQ